MNGAAAEDLALQYLQRQGLKLLMRNYRCRGGELDLVMRDGDTVVVTEVRQRSRSDFGDAAESVDARKRSRIVHATRTLLAEQPRLAQCPVRFDVCALDAANRISWLRAAFDAD